MTATSKPFIRGKSTSVWVGAALNSFLQYLAIDIDEDAMVTSGTYTTQRYNTGLSTPTWGPVDFSVSSAPIESPLTMQTRVGTTSGGTLDVPVDISTGYPVGSAQKQYITTIASFSVVSTTCTPPSLSSLSLGAATTGYFRGQCRNPGTAITSWGLFACNIRKPDDNVSVTLEVSTGTSCAATANDTAKWNSQANNSAISVSTAAFVAYRALFNFQSATQAIGSSGLAIQDCSFNWEEGAKRPETASAVLDHKYHLFYTTSTASGAVNSRALVLDFRDRWVSWDDIPATSAATLTSAHSLVIGDGASTGQAYRLYSGYSDDGASFTSLVRTKDFDAGDWRTRKEFRGVKLELGPLRDPTDAVNLAVTSHIDKSATNLLSSVGLGEDTGIIYGRVPTPLDSQLSGRYIGFELSNTGTQHWRFYRGVLQFRPLRED